MKEKNRNRKPSNYVSNCVMRYMTASGGQATMMAVLAMPAVMGSVGLATDFAFFNMKQSKLQSAADQAAIAGARELSLSGADSKTIGAAADSFSRNYMDDASLELQVTTVVNSANQNVKVTVSEIWNPFFAHFIGADVTPVVASATAGLFGESKLCVLALTTSGIGAVSMTKSASLKAYDCTVYSNSSSSASVYMGDTASIEAEHVCTVGGVKNNGSLNADRVVTDCPALADPLISRASPKFGTCDYNKTDLKSGKHTLKPGVYCGGLKISGAASVSLAPGDYIIKDGPLLVRDNATLEGDDVGFFLTGAHGVLLLLNQAAIDLSGRESGAMAGMLIFDDPLQNSSLRVHTISATNARNLTGTIYLPNGNLTVDPTASVGEDSAYTAIVVKRLIVDGGPTLVLNSNYDDTPVPVPEGIRSSSDIHLID